MEAEAKDDDTTAARRRRGRKGKKAGVLVPGWCNTSKLSHPSNCDREWPTVEIESSNTTVALCF
jgi:hypothetical protein